MLYVDSILTNIAEHTLLVTETGCEILTARKEDSPGGAIAMPGAEEANGAEAKAA